MTGRGATILPILQDKGPMKGFLNPGFSVRKEGVTLIAGHLMAPTLNPHGMTGETTIRPHLQGHEPMGGRV